MMAKCKKPHKVQEGGLFRQAALFCFSNFNPCEISEQNSVSVTLFRGNTQRWAANMVRCPLLVFTVLHDFTLNTEIQCTLL